VTEVKKNPKTHTTYVFFVGRPWKEKINKMKKKKEEIIRRKGKKYYFPSCKYDIIYIYIYMRVQAYIGIYYMLKAYDNLCAYRYMSIIRY